MLVHNERMHANVLANHSSVLLNCQAYEQSSLCLPPNGERTKPDIGRFIQRRSKGYLHISLFTPVCAVAQLIRAKKLTSRATFSEVAQRRIQGTHET